jgi:hypothetical protein
LTVRKIRFDAAQTAAPRIVVAAEMPATPQEPGRVADVVPDALDESESLPSPGEIDTDGGAPAPAQNQSSPEITQLARTVMRVIKEALVTDALGRFSRNLARGQAHPFQSVVVRWRR